MKGWVSLVGWPIADGLPTLVVTHQLQVERRRQGKFASQRPTFYHCATPLTECYSNHIITRISIRAAGLAFGGTGLCSYRVSGVDGSCAEHLTVESYTVFICQQSTYEYLVFHHPLTFIPGLNPSFSANHSHRSLPFLLRDSLHGFPRLFTVIFEHICFLLLVLMFLHFLVVGSVR